MSENHEGPPVTGAGAGPQPAGGRDSAFEGRLRQVETDLQALREVGAQVQSFNGALDEQAEVLEELAKLLHAQGQAQGPGSRKSKVNGRTAYRSDPAEFEAYVNELHPWVTWLNTSGIAEAHTRLGDIPDCWPSHAGVVEELLALHGAWAAAYLGEPDTDTMIAFHDRWLGPCLVRVMDVYSLRTCLDKRVCQARSRSAAAAVPPSR